MKHETAEWLAKADGDLRTAHREAAAKEWPNCDAACFHAQQCAEKAIKARMVEAALAFPRIRDLEALLDLVLPLEPAWEELRDGLRQLTSMAVEVRYPGVSADAEDAEPCHSRGRTRQTTCQRRLGRVTK